MIIEILFMVIKYLLPRNCPSILITNCLKPVYIYH